MLSGNEEIALRLGTALVLGNALGLNRELHGKPAGLRTHALVTLGAAVATLVALRSRSLFLPNEKEISHGRVSWQTPWVYFALGQLEIGIEKSAWTVSNFVNLA